MRSFDVVVIGSGSAGKPFTGEVSRAGLSVAVVERGLVGGECPYLACVPSKAMLLAARRHRLSSRPRPDAEAFADAVAGRDRVVHQRDDALAVKGLTEDGAQLFRGQATVRPGRRVLVGGDGGETELEYRNLVIATGAQAVLPPVDGLGEASVWTSDQALSSDELPPRLVILGGGPIGVELSQVYASFGSRVTLVESGPILLSGEPAWVGRVVAEMLGQQGVSVQTGTEVTSVSTSGDGTVVHAGDLSWAADRILVAVGKSPRIKGFGLDALGLDEDDALEVDARLRVMVGGRQQPDVFAIGDVTGIAPYTHTANYQARMAAAQILGHGIDADYTGVPRVVYTDPAVFAAGLTAEQARERGIDVRTATFDPADVTRSPLEEMAGTIEKAPSGLELVADAASGVLLGAAIVAPEADAWGHELALAVRTRRTVHELAQALHAYPSWAEAVHPPARELAEQIAAR